MILSKLSGATSGRAVVFSSRYVVQRGMAREPDGNQIQCALLPYYDKRNDGQVMFAIGNGIVPTRPPDMPELLWLLVQRCCKVERHERLAVERILETLHIQHLISELSHEVSSDPNGLKHELMQSQAAEPELEIVLLAATALQASIQRNLAETSVLDESTVRALKLLAETGPSALCSRAFWC